MSVAHLDRTPIEPNDALDQALRYIAHGLRVIPIGPGRKHPPIDAWQKAATTDEVIVRSWWTGLYRGHGVGIATGAESGVWVLDVDVAEYDKKTGEWTKKFGAESLADLEASYSPLPATVESITGTGGRHLFFAWDPAHPMRNNQSGKAGLDLDVRGEGGQVVAAPTIHPDTDEAYRWRPGHAPWEIAVAPAPAWLYGVMEREDEPEPRSAPAATPTGLGDDDSPAAAFNASTTWDALLSRDGWQLARTMGSGERRWVRPGKSGRDGISATVGHGGRDVLKVFTSSVPELDADRAYSRFGYEAAVRHNGDRSALARELRRRMSPERPAHDDLSWAAAGPALDRPVEEGTEAGDAWPDPEPLEPELTHGIPFPVEMLPAWMADQVAAVAESKQVPVDLTAMFALGALSVVCMGHAKVRLTGTEWAEYTNLYLTTALPPGAGKTPAFKAMTRCVTEFERELQEESGEAIREATMRRTFLEKRVKAAQDAAGMKSEDPEMALRDAVKLQGELDMLAVPALPRLLADDATPESLAMVMAEHGGRMNLLSDEGDMFDIVAGQYSGTGKSTNLSPYLKGHSAGAMKQDRVGRARVDIPEALLTVCVATQPLVLTRLGENPELAGRGLVSRFMYCVPASNVGDRDRYKVLHRMPGDVQRTYDEGIKALGRDLRRFTAPFELPLTVEARDLFLSWDQETEHRLRPGKDLAGVAEWVMKLRSSVLRLAGLLHLADGERGEIEAATLARALVIGDYWIDHARRVHAAWGNAGDQVLKRARWIVQWAVDQEMGSFSVRDAYIRCRSHENAIKVEAVNEAIERLEEMGWLRTGSDFPGSKGRKSPSVSVHPHAAAAMSSTRTTRRGVDDVGEGSGMCALCALRVKERYAFSSSLSTGLEDPGNFTPLRAHAHNAQVEKQESSPLSVTEAAPAPSSPAFDPADIYDDERGLL